MHNSRGRSSEYLHDARASSDPRTHHSLAAEQSVAAPLPEAAEIRPDAPRRAEGRRESASTGRWELTRETPQHPDG